MHKSQERDQGLSLNFYEPTIANEVGKKMLELDFETEVVSLKILESGLMEKHEHRNNFTQSEPSSAISFTRGSAQKRLIPSRFKFSTKIIYFTKTSN
jgi:hypothetical protein